MLSLTLAERLALLAETTGCDLRRTPSPLCARIWERARDAGYVHGELCVLRAPLTPGVGGSYNYRTGEIYIVQHAGEDERHTARTLLHEISHAWVPYVRPASIDDDWDGEVRTFRQAADLAARWGFDELLSDGWPDDEIMIIEERLRPQHHDAGALAGSRDYGIARNAWADMLALKREQGWDQETFALALAGIADDHAANADVLDFDRCALRQGWSLFEPGIDFGPFALAQDERSAAWLRSVLRRVARRDTAVSFFRRLGPHACVERLACVRLDRDAGLEHALAALNAALLDDPDGSALACWYLYADARQSCGQRIYRLSVRYGGQHSTEVWTLLYPRHETDVQAEAALQRFIQSWGRATGLRIAPLGEGLEELWSQLAVCEGA